MDMALRVKRAANSTNLLRFHLFLSISLSFVRNRIRLHAIVRVSVSARQTIAAVVVNVSEYLFHHKQNYPRRTQVDKY